MLALVGGLYDVERDAKELTDDQRASMRRESSAPILAQIEAWLSEQSRVALPKSPLGQAIAYAQSNWAALTRYLDAGWLAIDNNAAERAVKNVVIGRKNYLFCGSDVGGKTAAELYSITVTCKRLGLDPFRYLRDLLAAVSTHPANRLDELLPNRWSPPTKTPEL
jgi:hypothetical protein